MPRPRKNAECPAARERIIQAFWELLEDNRVSDISVAMVTDRAECNRGTFYYHFADMNALVEDVIDEELFSDGAIVHEAYGVLLDPETRLFGVTASEHVEHMRLVMRRGDAERLSEKIREAVLGMWQLILRPDGTPLKPETRMVLEYAVSGVIGILMLWARTEDEDLPCPESQSHLVSNAAGFLLSQISEAEGVPEQDIMARLKLVGSFAGMAR